MPSTVKRYYNISQPFVMRARPDMDSYSDFVEQAADGEVFLADSEADALAQWFASGVKATPEAVAKMKPATMSKKLVAWLNVGDALENDKWPVDEDHPDYDEEDTSEEWHELDGESYLRVKIQSFSPAEHAPQSALQWENGSSFDFFRPADCRLAVDGIVELIQSVQ